MGNVVCREIEVAIILIPFSKVNYTKGSNYRRIDPIFTPNPDTDPRDQIGVFLILIKMILI